MLKIIVILEGINAAVGIIANVFELSNPTYWNTAVFAIFFAGFAVILLYDKKFKQEVRESIYGQLKKDIEGMKLSHDEPKIQEGSLENISQQDKLLMMSLSLDMITQHGHMDWQGLFTDRASGIALNELMFRKCHRCKRPRNEQGDENYG